MSRSLDEELRLATTDHMKVGTIMPWVVDTPWWDHAANAIGRSSRMALMDAPEIVIDVIVKSCINPGEERSVGWMTKASEHTNCPGLTEQIPASAAKREANRGGRRPFRGALHEPMFDGLGMDGGIRARMKQ